MYAVIKTGGKQYRVSEGDVLEVENLSVKGDNATFTPVLVVTDSGETIYGAKDLKGYPVAAKVLGGAKGDKVTVFKYRNKSGYATKTGHRQSYSTIEITSIGGQGERKSTKTKTAEASSETDKSEESSAETTS